MRKVLFIVFAGGVILGSALLWFELPIVFARNAKETAQKIAALEPIALSGKTLFVSDFQLTEPEAKVNIGVDGVEQVVIIGDFFHSQSHFELFGQSVQERVQNGLAVFLKERFEGNVYFISAYTHDPQLEPFEFDYGDMRFFHVGKAAKFVIDSLEVVALHGNELHDGVIGGGVSWLVGKLGMPLPLERLGKRHFGIEEKTWFFAGHSHVPGLDQESRTGNTGSFVGAPLNDLVFRLPIGTGIMVENGEAELVHFDTPPASDIYPF